MPKRIISIIVILIVILTACPACNVINRSVNSGSGSDKAVDEIVTVQYFLRSILRRLGYSIKDSEGFEHVIDKALELGILKKDEKGEADKPINRALAARICIRTIREPNPYPENYTEYASKIKDFDKVPEHLQDAVLRSCVKGIIYEDQNGMFKPEEIIKKSEINSILDRIIFMEMRREFKDSLPVPVEVEKDYAWADCEDVDDIIPSPIWSPGSPRISLCSDNKTQGNASIRVDYTPDSSAWYMVGISPNISAPLDFTDIDYMEFDLFNNTSVERVVSFRFRDSQGTDYFCYTNYERPYGFYGEGKIPQGKTGWIKVRVYFDHINIGQSDLPADNRDGLKDMVQLMLIFDDKGTGGQSNYLLLDNFKFYKLNKPDTSAKTPRLPKKIDESNKHFALYSSIVNNAKKLENDGKNLEACKEYIRVLEISPFVDEINQKIISLYRDKLGDAEKTEFKKSVSDLYFYWITDDFDKAKGIQDLYRKLVEIKAAEKEIFSYGASAQTIGPGYSFTEENRLTETAKVIESLGADTIKIAIGGDHFKMYGIEGTRPETLQGYVENKYYKQVLDSPSFKNYLMWTYSHFSDNSWFGKGYIDSESCRKEYEDIYNLTRYLLSTYNDTGKSFYLGNWEGDWHINTFDRNDATLPQLYSMTEWLNVRQRAVADARRDTPHKNVDVKFYVEVCIYSYNELFYNAARIMNCILPYINCEYVSLSSYQSTGTMQCKLGLMEKYYTNAMNYLEYMCPPADIPGRRVWVGEFGFPTVLNSPEQQNQFVKDVLKVSFKLGVPFTLYWNTYCNEARTDTASGFAGFWLVNTYNVKQPVYYTLQMINQKSKAFVEDFKKKNGRMPTQGELFAESVKWLD